METVQNRSEPACPDDDTGDAGDHGQRIITRVGATRVMALDTAYQAHADNRGRDVLVVASHCGVVPARVIAEHRPRAVVMVDCGIGLHGSGIAGLHYFEGAEIPAAAADVATVLLGDADDLYAAGLVSFVNALAEQVGVRPGMPVAQAADLLVRRDAAVGRTAREKAHRVVVHESPAGAWVVCMDSIAFAEPGDEKHVLCIGGHAGRAAVDYVRRLRPRGVIGTDGGIAKDRSALFGLAQVDGDGIAWAAVDVATARLGDGHSTWRDGVIAHANITARARGVTPGQFAREAARLLAEG